MGHPPIQKFIAVVYGGSVAVGAAGGTLCYVLCEGTPATALAGENGLDLVQSSRTLNQMLSSGQRPLKGFVLGDKQYHDAALGEWTGFYDWLRDSESNLLGVRYWLAEHTAFLVDRTKGLNYVKADPPRHIEIYFSEQRRIEPKLSCDQDFLYDPVFVSRNEEYALGFAMEGLNEPNLRSLEKAPVVRPLE